MTEEEIEGVAQRAARDEVGVPAIAKIVGRLFWPNWKARSALQRVNQELDPHNGANPLKARTWFAVLAETGDDEMLEQAVSAHAEGKAAKAKRELDRAVGELENQRTRMRKVRSRTAAGRYVA